LPFRLFRGLLGGEFSRCMRCLPCGLFCFQTCSPLRCRLRGAVRFLFRGLLRGAFRLAGSRFSGKPGPARLFLLASQDGCQIILFRGAPGDRVSDFLVSVYPR
jgi:hypothetical protein